MKQEGSESLYELAEVYIIETYKTSHEYIENGIQTHIVTQITRKKLVIDNNVTSSMKMEINFRCRSSL